MNNTEIQLDINAPISREALYQLVWSEPMLKVAARFGLSSSYMARVCTALNVPRPAAGYWGKAAVGRAPAVPALPQVRPGDQLTWTKGEAVNILAKLARPASSAPPRVQARTDDSGQRASPMRAEKVTGHYMVSGMKGHFEKGRYSHDVGYLKPDKKALADIIVTRATLDRALSFANLLFEAFEARQHRVSFARDYEETQRVAPDVLERPAGPLGGYSSLWVPSHPTVVFVGDVRFGLTVIETAEDVLARYVGGKYIRDSEYTPPKRRFGHDSTWTTKRQFATGRLRLQAYSAFRGTDWKRHWDEKDQPLDSQVDAIVSALEKSAVAVSRLIEESRRKSELEQREREAQHEKWRREGEQRRIAEAHKQSQEELRRIISAWVEAKEREAFFADAESKFSELAGDLRVQLLGRVERGRQVLSSADVLEQFARWRSPEERVKPNP